MATYWEDLSEYERQAYRDNAKRQLWFIHTRTYPAMAWWGPPWERINVLGPCGRFPPYNQVQGADSAEQSWQLLAEFVDRPLDERGKRTAIVMAHSVTDDPSLAYWLDRLPLTKKKPWPFSKRCNPENPKNEKNRLATEKFARALSRKYSVDLWLSRQGVNDEFLIVSGITVPPDQRNEGIGTRVMEEVIAWGHARGLTLALTPEPIENRGSVRAKNRLIRFYRRLGFIPNKGRNREFRIRESMILRPNPGNIYCEC